MGDDLLRITELIDDLNIIFEIEGDIMIKAYFKFRKGIKTYYDFNLSENDIFLNGSYEIVSVQQLIYYLSEELNMLT